MLRAENENLKNENYRLQAALSNIVCPNCGGPAMLGEMGFDEQQIRLENARLKEEVIFFLIFFSVGCIFFFWLFFVCVLSTRIFFGTRNVISVLS